MAATCTDVVNVFVVAPPMLSWGLERLVQSALPGIVLAGSASSLAEATECLSRCPADVAVIDLDGGCPAEDLVDFAAAQRCQVLVLTSANDVGILDRAVAGGVRGVVRKSDPPQALLKAIKKVHDGELWIDRSAAGRIFMEVTRHYTVRDCDPEQLKIALLTSRERQTIVAVSSDTAVPGKVIASRLRISEHTLRNRLSSIYDKLEVQNRLDLFAYATKHRLHR